MTANSNIALNALTLRDQPNAPTPTASLFDSSGLQKSNLAHQFRELILPQSITSERVDLVRPAGQIPLVERLFDQRSELKVQISKVSMHLDETWQRGLFAQIDRLFNHRDWDDDSAEIPAAAFRTFLRFVLFSAPKVLPSLTVAPNGDPVCSWFCDERRVHIEFLRNDQSNVVISKPTERGLEAVSWRGPVANIRDFITAFRCADCLGWEDGKTSQAAKPA